MVQLEGPTSDSKRVSFSNTLTTVIPTNTVPRKTVKYGPFTKMFDSIEIWDYLRSSSFQNTNKT